MEIIDKTAFLAPRLPEDDVPIGDTGLGVRVRGMSRYERLTLRQLGTNEDGTTDEHLGEVWVLARCIISPKLTEDEVRVWREGGTGAEVQAVVDKILDLSGIGKKAEEEDEERFPEPGDPGGTAAGAGPEDDSGPAPNSDVVG